MIGIFTRFYARKQKNGTDPAFNRYRKPNKKIESFSRLDWKKNYIHAILLCYVLKII